MIHCIPIWDVLAARGERVGAGEQRATRPRCPGSQLGRRCQLGFGLGFAPGARWVGVFMVNNVYYSQCNVFTCNLLFLKYVGRQEWVDGIGYVWMTLSRLGRCSQLGWV